jgi:hypothetical protein
MEYPEIDFFVNRKKQGLTINHEVREIFDDPG